jgi:hypothetical protein
MSGLLTPSHADWQNHVGTRFDVDGTAPGSHELVLRECTPARTSGGITSFSLRFLAPTDPRLQQGTYQFTAGEIGPVAIFIVPTGPGQDDNTTEFEAVYNQQEIPTR